MLQLRFCAPSAASARLAALQSNYARHQRAAYPAAAAPVAAAGAACRRRRHSAARLVAAQAAPTAQTAAAGSTTIQLPRSPAAMVDQAAAAVQAALDAGRPRQMVTLLLPVRRAF